MKSDIKLQRIIKNRKHYSRRQRLSPLASEFIGIGIGLLSLDIGIAYGFRPGEPDQDADFEIIDPKHLPPSTTDHETHTE